MKHNLSFYFIFYKGECLPLAVSSTEPPKGSANESRSGSRSEDVSGDLSPSISFSNGGRRRTRTRGRTQHGGGHDMEKDTTWRRTLVVEALHQYQTETSKRGQYRHRILRQFPFSLSLSLLRLYEDVLTRGVRKLQSVERLRERQQRRHRLHVEETGRRSLDWRKVGTSV